MADFYYQVDKEKQAYHIDDASQQILMYLYSNRESMSEKIIEAVSTYSKSDISMRLNEVLGDEEAGLITHPDPRQTTFSNSNQPTYYELTKEGENFVKNNKSNLSMPDDFNEIKNKIKILQGDITSIQDSMHRIDTNELNEQLSEFVERLDSIQDHISNYE